MTESLASSWDVDLRFRAAHQRSVLGKQYVSYPYHITRLLYEDIDQRTIPKLILQSLSGGIYQGERLQHRFALEPNASVDIRTQGSTIVHHTRGGSASSTTYIDVGPGSALLYVPEPQIIFDGADFVNSVNVKGGEQARLAVVSDSFLAYDPVSQLTESDFRFVMATSLVDSNDLTIAVDKSIVHGSSYRRVMNCYRGYASFMFQGIELDMAFMEDCCREIELLEAEAAFSTLPGEAGFSLKALAANGVVLSKVLEIVRARSRQLLTLER